MGLEPVPPTAADAAAFMILLYRIKGGDLGPEVAAGMAGLAGALCDAGAEAVIAGCTEVPLVLSGEKLTIPLIDAGQTLAERCVASPVSLGGVPVVKKIIAAAVALSALALAASPAAAYTYPAAGVTAQEVAAVLKAKGLPAEIATDDG
eukprot:gene46541-63049_t